ncbi:MAG TPA: GntR family transcriptional regulator [Actinoplanes sp.]|nr:GntR family transcriptional regulator [Actinoplanes sp.]
MSRVPAYRQIALDLTEKIRTGVYRPGEALPAQRELSVRYGVTLMTLRQALSSLRDDGLIVQHAGRGTFVAPVQATYRVDTLRSFVEDLREQGHDVTTEVLSKTVTDGLRLERVRYLGDQPVIHQTSWVPEPHGSRVGDEDFRRVSLYVALAEAGVTIVRASERIVPGLLDTTSAARLGRPAGSPVFVSERTTYSMDDEPVVTDRAVILGDLMEIRAERAATRISVQWGTVRECPGA